MPARPPAPAEATGQSAPWDSTSALRLVALLLLLRAVQSAVLALPSVRSLSDTALLGLRVALSVGFYAVLLELLAARARRVGLALRDAVALRPASASAFTSAVAVAVLAVIGEVLWLTVLARLGIDLPGRGDPLRAFGSGPGAIAALIFVGVVVGPVVEEMVFRGAVLPALASRMGVMGAVWGSALLFGLVHADVRGLVPLVLLAVLLAELRLRSGSLWPPIVAHATFNLLVLALGLAARG